MVDDEVPSELDPFVEKLAALRAAGRGVSRSSVVMR